ncbi:MAG: type II toxin-antitoxin system Phd/YefM family antitoxin [Anaerolineae bacterium]
MATVGAYEAKTRLSELLRRVSRGESFVITHHGKAVAALVPAEPGPSQPVEEVIAALKAFRQGRSLGDFSVRQLIDEGRA